MKVAMTKKLTGRVLSLFAASVVLGTTGLAIADTKPHFRTSDGSIFAGGWFYDSAGNCQTGAATYQTSNYPPIAPDKYNGGILGFAENRVGAHSNLDAFALGLIEGAPAGDASDYGFFSGLSGTGALSFSNTDAQGVGSAFWGGLFEGPGARPAHCIPDYWNKQNSPPATSGAGGVSFGAANGKYRINPGGVLTVGGGFIDPVSSSEGRKLSYFVNGDVFINGDIRYRGHNANNVPKFVMVVRGNIYISPNVTNLDGWYIAQPRDNNNPNSTDGEVWTCVDPNNPEGSPPSPKDTWVRSNCLDRTLTVGGAITAKQVNLLRLNSGLGSSNAAASAEIVNFTPEMVIGGPFFNEPPDPGQGLDSLISLPPVF